MLLISLGVSSGFPDVPSQSRVEAEPAGLDPLTGRYI